MSIFPLPQFEADLEEARRDAEEYARLSIPKTLVVRFGVMKLIGEYAYSGDVKPGCGSKVVVRTHRGTELAEMLTSTCPNAGCSKSITRKEILEYVENSGGTDYPFFSEGRVLRIATIEDMNEQARLDGLRPAMIRYARERVEYLNLPMKIIEAEPILGAERLTFYFTSEDRVDFRDLVHELSNEFKARIELRQVGARDEARLVADYEKCGQHCCCKQFLKVLKPVSIKSAKTQKATLDPLKISGRCGRLMCCLRYEDQTYDELVKRLPKMKKRVGTPQGVGIVIDRQILTQLVLVRLEHDGTDAAFPVEEITAPENAPPPPDPLRGLSQREAERRAAGPDPRSAPSGAPERGTPNPRDKQEQYRERWRREQYAKGPPPSGAADAPQAEGTPTDSAPPRPSERPHAPRPPRDANEERTNRPRNAEGPGRPPRNQEAGGSPPRAESPPRSDRSGEGNTNPKRRRRKKKGGGGGAFGGGGSAFG